MYACMYVCMYVCIDVCMHVCMHAWMYVWMYVCMYARMDVCMDVCMYVWMHACMYICMYVELFFFRCLFMHTNIIILFSPSQIHMHKSALFPNNKQGSFHKDGKNARISGYLRIKSETVSTASIYYL